jgi:LytS/YehU family sensor histidine kinase
MLIHWDDHSYGLSAFSETAFQAAFVTCVLLVGVFYSNYFVLIPRFYLNKKFIHQGLSYFSLFGLLYLFCCVWEKKNYPVELGAVLVFPMATTLALSSLLRVNYHWKNLQTVRNDLESGQLKEQLSPHFLYNTLNGIYSLALLKSEETPEAILKLSNLLRYVSNKETPSKVNVEEDIEYLENYIHLQQLRAGATAQISYQKEVNASGLKIVPMLTWVFVDNAIKFGINPEFDSPISIDLKVSESRFFLKVMNRKMKLPQNLMEQKEVGTSKTIEALNLFYPNRHELHIHDDIDTYTVELSINL